MVYQWVRFYFYLFCLFWAVQIFVWLPEEDITELSSSWNFNLRSRSKVSTHLGLPSLLPGTTGMAFQHLLGNKCPAIPAASETQ